MYHRPRLQIECYLRSTDPYGLILGPGGIVSFAMDAAIPCTANPIDLAHGDAVEPK
jgi:hypothetical protein